MSVPAPAPIPDTELLARFILFSAHVRADGTLRPDPFIPHPHPDLSVTRHAELPEGMIWGHGHAVASEVALKLKRQLPLLGRADVSAFDFRKQKLRLEPAPTPGNDHHVNATGWPADKASQKIIAQEIAACAGFLPAPA